MMRDVDPIGNLPLRSRLSVGRTALVEKAGGLFVDQLRV
jgi:hypothetical protein